MSSAHEKGHTVDVGFAFMGGRDEDEFQSDQKYLACLAKPTYSYYHDPPDHPLKTYKGPESLTVKTRSIIKSRHERSFASNAFPPNIVVNKKESTTFHRRLEKNEDVRPWETPVPRHDRGSRFVPLNDGGKVSYAP